MSKTLLVAEKPSVGQDLARVLPGPFKKSEGFLEGPDHVITWAVGHLVQLAEPEAYDAKYKSWRMADLPIVPDRFKLVVRDERSRKQMSVVTKQLGREDVDEVVNACDAGREGELIFAYLFEKAKGKKPVKRLWLNSMTSAAMKSALASLRPAQEFERLEEAARSRSEADWIVGMNATRAATIRLRSSFDGAVSLGRVQTPTLAIVARREEEIKAFVPEPYWLVDATFAAGPLDGRERWRARLRRPLPGARRQPGQHEGPAHRHRGGGARDRRRLRGQAGHDHQAREERAARESADALRPDDAAARGQQPLRLLRQTHAGGGAAPLRGAQGAHLPAHQLALPDDRHGRGDQADRRARRRAQGVPQRRRVRGRPRRAAAGARRQRREGHRPPRDHPHALRAQPREDGLRRPAHLRHGRAALPRRLPPRGGVREHARGDDRRRCIVPRTAATARAAICSARAASCCSCRAGAASTTRSPPTRRPRKQRRAATTRRRPTSSCRGCSPTSRCRRASSRAPARKPNRRGATATRRCSARWRPPASSSTTTSCARR